MNLYTYTHTHIYIHNILILNICLVFGLHQGKKKENP